MLNQSSHPMLNCAEYILNIIDENATRQNVLYQCSQLSGTAMQSFCTIALTAGINTLAPSLLENSALAATGIRFVSYIAKDAVINCLINKNVTLQDIRNTSLRGCSTYLLSKGLAAVFAYQLGEISDITKCDLLKNADNYKEITLSNELINFIKNIGLGTSRELLKDAKDVLFQALCRGEHILQDVAYNIRDPKAVTLYLAQKAMYGYVNAVTKFSEESIIGKHIISCDKVHEGLIYKFMNSVDNESVYNI
jgi:hypothetical protein